MPAPALLLLAHGTTSAPALTALEALRQTLRTRRPQLSTELVFVDQPEAADEAAGRIQAAGLAEVGIVPLDLARAVEPDEATTAVVTRLRERHQGLSIGVSRPVGPASTLLTVLDERLRTALRATRTIELDGLVLSLPGGGDVRGNALVSRRARQWASHHRLPVVVAVADGSGPGVATAVSSLRAQGRRHIAMGSLFIAETDLYQGQVEQASAAGVVAVSKPIGPDHRLVELIMARYSYAAMELLDVPEWGSGGVEDFDLDETV